MRPQPREGPNATICRRREDGRTRGARYKYKIIICYKQKNIYCTSLTHIHKNTIYTECLGGARALQGGFWETLLPRPVLGGLYRQHISPQKSRQADTHHSNGAWMEWSVSPARGEREAKRMGRRQGRRGAPSPTHKVLGVSSPSEQIWTPREASATPGERFCSQVGL